jgi:hypothetical protein
LKSQEQAPDSENPGVCSCEVKSACRAKRGPDGCRVCVHAPCDPRQSVAPVSARSAYRGTPRRLIGVIHLHYFNQRHPRLVLNPRDPRLGIESA